MSRAVQTSVSVRLFVFIGKDMVLVDELAGRNDPVPVEIEPEEQRPRFVAGDVMPNGTVFDPARHRINKNGTVTDTTTGKFIVAPAPEHAPITQSNAKAYAHKRWELSRAAFAAGVAEGMVSKGAAPVDAWQAVGAKSAELLKSAKSARGFADLARFTGEAAGFVPMARAREDMTEKETAQPQIINLIFQFLQAKQEPPEDVIDV